MADFINGPLPGFDALLYPHIKSALRQEAMPQRMETLNSFIVALQHSNNSLWIKVSSAKSEVICRRACIDQLIGPKARKHSAFDGRTTQ